jgi:hypothetical protein
MTVMNSPTIHHLRAERQTRRSASASSAACYCLADSEPAVAARYPDATSVLSSNADRWTVLPASKLARLAARSHLANVDVGEPKLPANTLNFNEAATAIDSPVSVVAGNGHAFDSDHWLARQIRNLQAQPGRRGRDGPGPVRKL